MSKFSTCLTEIEKMAFGPEAMNKTLRAFKALQIKSPASENFSAINRNASLFKSKDPSRTITSAVGDAASLFKKRNPDVAPKLLDQISAVPSNRKALDAVIKGHELAEAQVKPTHHFRNFGHYSPDVILREHNMIQTLPKQNESVGQYMREMRSGREAEALRDTTGFQYGQGPRISRHARKRLLETHDKELNDRADFVRNYLGKNPWKPIE